ncbi:hypothetical protein [Edaphobacter albus]|uniref:hypothetical protein n=1 Tax=Edaphobacter sp. 4G125 TaxID=2763071 RepID=UPI0016490F61|nr:hypothetical protein [Edaphobacter sp. 4G125]QNI36113.1 hypothetical protein H7846_14070 [Edaphobacter sp. 4G125]
MSDEILQKQSDAVEAERGKLRWTNTGSFLFALLQSGCAAFMAVSGFRTLIGLGALASGFYGSAQWFHGDAIRIPMMIFALGGALFNLYSVWRVRSLRARPAAQWRVQPVSGAKLRSERLQVTLAIVTLFLLAAEWMAHGEHSILRHFL